MILSNAGLELTCNDAKKTKLHSSSLPNFGTKQALATSSAGFDAAAFAYDSMKEESLFLHP